MYKFRSMQDRRRGVRLFVVGAMLLLLISCAPETSSSTPDAPGADAPDMQAIASPSPIAPTTDVGNEQDLPVNETDGSIETSASLALGAPLTTNQFTDAGTGALIYTGELVARAEVNIVAEVPGEVLEVIVEVGDQVQVGDVLVRLDSAQLEAQRAQALAGLEAIQAQFELLTAPAREADLAAAQAAVAAASAAYRRAVDGATDEDLRIAEAQLRSAQAAVTLARAAYNQVKGDQNVAARQETLQLRQAELQVEAAQAQYDKVALGATQDVIAGAYAQLAQARVRLKNLQDGASPEQIEALAAQVEQTETALYLAQLQVSKATVRSPINGIVARISTSTGAMASPGAPMLVLYSGGIQVSIPVEELRLPQIRVGQSATIAVAAYPGQVYPGVVAWIAPELDASTRTARVTILPIDAVTLFEGEAHSLAPGMFATVELQSE